jgi:N-acyl-L-homoserine lactone synthetase
MIAILVMVTILYHVNVRINLNLLTYKENYCILRTMSAVQNKFISNEQAVTTLESSAIFDANPDVRFSAVLAGRGMYPDDATNELFYRYGQLRANVYIDQTGMLPESDRREDGTEWDYDDDRSLHFMVMENKVASASVFACMRLIVRDESPLPIETYFPEAFENAPAPVGSDEVSRLIAVHPDFRPNMDATDMLLAGANAHINNNNLGPTYAVVEPKTETYLRKKRVVFERIAEPKFVPEYNDYNVGIRIDTLATAARMAHKALAAGPLVIGEFKFWGALPAMDIAPSAQLEGAA